MRAPGFLRRLFAPRAGYATLGERAFADQLREYLGTAAGVPVSEHTALQIGAVWSCVRVIAESLAMLPIDIISRANGTRQQLSAHPVHYMLNVSPDDEIAAYYWREALHVHALLWSGGYAEIVRDTGGRPARLYLLSPPEVRPKRNEAGVLGYEIKRKDVWEWLPADRIFHLRGPTWDGTAALEIVRLARECLSLTAAMEIFGGSFFGNGAQLGTRYSTDKALRKDQVEELRGEIEKLHGGARNAFRAAILHSGLKVMDSTMPLRDAQFLEARRFQILEIARWFRVPPHLLAELDRATHANIEHEQMAFVSHCLMPWAARFENEANLKFFGRNNKGVQQVKLNFGALLRGDMRARAETLQIMRRNGIVSANEWRALEDLNPIDGGDLYIVERNMATLQQIERPDEPLPSAVPAVSNATGAETGAEKWNINVHCPPMTTLVESPQIHAHVSVPEREVHIENRAAPVNVTVPEREVRVENHGAPVNVTVPEREVRVDNHAAPVNVTVPEREVRVQNTVESPEVRVTMPRQKIEVTPSVVVAQPKRTVETIERDEAHEIVRVVREAE